MAGLLRERMKEGREKITAGRVWERGEVIKSFFFLLYGGFFHACHLQPLQSPVPV